ncbi:hypothetical protein XENOCAPTIV_029172 [Xenoophorus captivus]|uniref:DNA-dependent protein kinase catalytic subunit CC3 domain-containing protein n=1 Tax=Xenoophorus captivus TaxID=1517983 RepID=A0ABV0RVL6_9TELE
MQSDEFAKGSLHRNNYMDCIRKAMMERVLLPLASHCSTKTLSDFFLLKKNGCFKLMELLYSRLPKDEVYSKESRINQAYCRLEETEGNESCFEAFTENMAGETQMRELRRSYHCAAYNCAIAVISCSFSEPKFYQGFLFSEKPEKAMLTLELDTVYTKSTLFLPRPEKAPVYLSSQSYMADSSLSEEMSQFDFSTGVQSFSFSSQNPQGQKRTVVKKVFRPYAKHWLGPLLQLVVSGNNGGVGIHFMVVDIVVTILDEVLANRLLEFLMRHSFHQKRAVFRHNLEIIRTLVECWKDCLHVPYRYIQSLSNNVSFTRYKEVYSAAAEIIGLVLKSTMERVDVRQSRVFPAPEAARHLKDSLSGVRAEPSRCDPRYLPAVKELRFHSDDEPQVGPEHLPPTIGSFLLLLGTNSK